MSAAPEGSLAEELTLPCHLGRYRVTTRVAAGNFAVVYKGRDEKLNRDVAIKLLKQRLSASSRILESFLVEARILGALNHPGIVPIYDIGQTDKGIYYLVSRFVEGCDLKARLKEGPMSVRDAVSITASVAEALNYAHQNGLVHRDIKPGNILLDQQSQPLLVDFGLAMRREDFGRGPTDIGTPLYMSPEQARKEGHRADARSDIYSLGVVFYEMLTGRHPFTGNTMEALREFILSGEPVPPSQINPEIDVELDRIWSKATARHLSSRYPEAAALAQDLRRFEAKQSMPTQSDDGIELTTRRGKRSSHQDTQHQSVTACLVHLYPVGPKMGSRVMLDNTPLVLGRNEECGIRITHDSVSRKHASIQPDPTGYTVMDLSSTNGTYVNQKRIQTHRLQDGEYLSVGNHIFRFLSGDQVVAAYQAELQRLADIDALTEIYNRRKLLEFLGQELANASRSQHPLSLLLVDIDKFEIINDRLGYLCGESILRQLAACLKSTIRKEDFLARWSGEEFAIVLPETSGDVATQIAEQVRRKVEQHPFGFDDEAEHPPVRVSLGVASAAEKVWPSADELIRKAEEKLKQAKQLGRNRVAW